MNPTTPQSHYFVHDLAGILHKFRGVCDWFSQLGFDYAKTRYGTYKRHFEAFERFAKQSEVPRDVMPLKRAFDNAYIEAHEIIRVCGGLRRFGSEQFIDQLTKVISGQEFRGNTENDKARDFLFELSTATRFIRAGYKVSLTGICDIVAMAEDESTIYIECKRTKSERGIAGNVRKANRQISKRVRDGKDQGSRGLVALNVTDLMPHTGGTLPDSQSAASSAHRQLSANIVRTNMQALSTGMRPESMGVIIESTTMWYFSPRAVQQSLSCSRHTDFLDYGTSETFRQLPPRISNQDIEDID